MAICTPDSTLSLSAGIFSHFEHKIYSEMTKNRKKQHQEGTFGVWCSKEGAESLNSTLFLLTPFQYNCQVTQDSYIETIATLGNSLSLLCIPIIRITFIAFILLMMECFLYIPWRCRRSAIAWNKKRNAVTQGLNRIVRLIDMQLKL